MNEKIWLYYYNTSIWIVFVRFLGELKTPKRHFEINWPLKRGISFNEQRFSNEYFEYDFVEDLETVIPAWKAWFVKILQINSKFCLVNYEKLKTNVIEELMPMVNFLGFDINEELAKCILINQEGANHRPEKSKDEINRILSFIPPDDLKRYSEMKEDVLQMLKNASSC
jgi:ADP-dependent phosphofructokinase/glucokinase